MQVKRADYDQDPRRAYREISEQIGVDQRSARERIMVRDQILREIAGTDRGGVAKLAEDLGVTHTQAGRLLAEGLVRAVRAAAESAGLGRDEVSIRTTGQAHPARVMVTLAIHEDDAAEIDPAAWMDPAAWEAREAKERGGWIDRMNNGGALVGELRKTGMIAVGDGMAMDVGEAGPCHALADGREVEVSWVPL